MAEAQPLGYGPPRLLYLQRAAGNRSVSALLGEPASLPQQPDLIQRQPAPKPPAASSPVQQMNDIIKQNRNKYTFLKELPATASLYPGEEKCQDGHLYYRPDEPAEAAASIKAKPQGRQLYYKRFVIGYDYFKVVICLGPNALKGSPDDLLSALHHEWVHAQQLRAIRKEMLKTADNNKAALGKLQGFKGWWLNVKAKFGSQEQQKIFDSIVPEKGAEAAAGAATKKAQRVDLTRSANREVLAHSQTFAAFFPAAVGAATDQIRQLLAPIPAVGSSPGWSYDDADAEAKAKALKAVVSVIKTPEDAKRFYNSVLPDLRQSAGAVSSPTRFLAELEAEVAKKAPPPAPGPQPKKKGGKAAKK